MTNQKHKNLDVKALSPWTDSVQILKNSTQKRIKHYLKTQDFSIFNKISCFFWGKLKKSPWTDSVQTLTDSVQTPWTDSVQKHPLSHCYNRILANLNTRTVPFKYFCINYIKDFSRLRLWKTKNSNNQRKSIILRFLIIGILSVSNLTFADSPSSFNKAKKLMYSKIYIDHQQTFYCGCDYSNRKVNLESCGYQVRKNKKRAQRTEAEHVVPAYWLANLTPAGRACWAEGTKRKDTNGRKHCLKTNPQFK